VSAAVGAPASASEYDSSGEKRVVERASMGGLDEVVFQRE
jgi:hypothetical protein